MLHFFSGCGEHLTTAQKSMKWDVFQDAVVSPAGGYLGTAAIDQGLTSYTRPRCVKRVTLSPGNEVIYGWRFFEPSAFPLAGFGAYLLGAIHRAGSGTYSSATKQLSLNVETDGRISVHRGDYTGTLLGTTAAPVLGNAAWTMVEAHVVIHATVGSVVIRVNNVIVLALSGVNTQGLATSAIDGIEFIPWRFDDVYILDPSGSTHTSFLGKGFHVVPLRMSANSTVAWTPASGSNVSRIADATPDLSTNKASIAGLIDLFTPATLAAYDRVIAVQGNTIGHRASSAFPATVSQVVEIDGAPYLDDAAAVSLGITDRDCLHIWPVAPDDNAEWTVAKINASKFGYKRVA